MKIFYKTRIEQRNSPIKGKRVDEWYTEGVDGTPNNRRWAIEINVKKS